jgi:putative transposase
MKNQKNGFYTRQLYTKCGWLENLSVLRDRQNTFQTELFSPYQRGEEWLKR